MSDLHTTFVNPNAGNYPESTLCRKFVLRLFKMQARGLAGKHHFFIVLENFSEAFLKLGVCAIQDQQCWDKCIQVHHAGRIWGPGLDQHSRDQCPWSHAGLQRGAQVQDWCDETQRKRGFLRMIVDQQGFDEGLEIF